jgi:hypothetical protein
MTDANNSGNNSQGGTIVITGAGGGGGGGVNGQWITVAPGKQFTITIPSGGGVCSTGGTITLSTGACPQISFDDIDLAVPVEEKKKDSDGCNCKKCREFFPYAEPNQDDGTLICYGCRMVW